MFEYYVLAGALALALVVALVSQRRNGRFSRKPTVAQGPVFDVEAVGGIRGERATLVQFSSAFCAPCRTTRVVLGQVVDLVPGVTTVEVDAESHLDLVRELQILRTPTVLIVDASGNIVTRASGAPTKENVLASLASHLPDLNK
ncbi:MAG: thioredoxin family protein [Actinomycetales bacterium]|nr:thioredoxin family protein [Actinomycetales bacterium]